MSIWAQCYQLNEEERETIRTHLAERYARMEHTGELASLDIDGEAFLYAVIPRTAIAPDYRLQQKFVNNYAYGFTIPQEGGRISFVLDEVPDAYHAVVAAHEYVENQEQDHAAAIDREIAMAEAEGCLDGYLAWMETHYPGLVDERMDRL